MALSYNKLWNLMRDNKMKKGDLFAAAKIGQGVAKKFNNNEPVNIKYLMNICKIFHCELNDIVELIEDDTTVDNNF